MHSIDNGVWYTFTPANNAVVTVNTCGSDYNTVLQVFTGHCGALTLSRMLAIMVMASPAQRIEPARPLMARRGVNYLFSSARNLGGRKSEIQATLSPPLPNDRCDGAIVLTNGVTFAENTATATSLGDPNYWYNSKGVWFSFTPSADGILTVSTCDSDYRTEVQLFTGGCNPLTPVPDGFDYGNGPLCQNNSSLALPARAGTNYLIYVTAYNNGGFGNLQIQATLQPPLPNDQCSGAIDISDGAVHSTDTTIATSVGDVTNGCGGNIEGVWYRLTPLATSLITLHLESTNLHPTLELSHGTCGQLMNLNCVYNYYGYHVDLTFTGFAGETYFIQAGDIYRRSGNLKISAGAFPPFNDQLFNAIPMVAGFNYNINTAYASSTNDPVPLCDATAGHGVWYSYTPSEDAQVMLETCQSDFETVVQLYSSDGSTLTPVACNDGFGPACATNRASLSFFAKTGTNYFILAAGKNGAFGNLIISVNGDPPGNDNCESAIEMTEGVVYTNNTTYASSTTNALPVIKDVWYRFTPTRSELLLLTTCGSDFHTAFNVYTGACNALTYFNNAVSDGSGVCGTNAASAEFSVSAGTTYYIDVGGFLLPTNSGNLSIVATSRPPPNDTCTTPPL